MTGGAGYGYRGSIGGGRKERQGRDEAGRIGSVAGKG